jgi:hypothetical protein
MLLRIIRCFWQLLRRADAAPAAQELLEQDAIDLPNTAHANADLVASAPISYRLLTRDAGPFRRL